jgi:Tfp pilus assembly protein PilF
MLARAGRIYETALGTNHQSYAKWLVLEAQLLAIRGEENTAIEHYLHAISIMKGLGEAEHPVAARAFTGLGDIMQRRGDQAQALLYYRSALEIDEKIHGAEHASTADARNAVAEGLLVQQRYAEAREQLERARQSLEGAPGAQSDPMARTLANLAESHLGSGDPATALPLAQRALDLWQSRGSKTTAAAWARFVLARCLWEIQGDRARARQLAQEARALLDGAPRSPRAAAIDAWLASPAHKTL